MNDLERVRGMLYGLAIGDALGYPTEFRSLAEIKQHYGAAGIQDLPAAPALFSDDTQMTIAITEALIATGERDIEAIMAATVEEFITWLDSPENNRAPGNTCLAAVRKLKRGVKWQRSGNPDSKGCGSAMRSAPIGYLYQHDAAKLREVAHATGIATHGHAAGDAACIATAYLTKLALDDVAPRDMPNKLLDFVGDMSDEFNAAIRKIADCLDWHDEEAALEYLGRGWVGEEAGALALYCVMRYPDDYVAVVRRGANTEGDSDSIACIAGAISGARLGIAAIPADWVKRIEQSAYLGDLAARLARKKNEFLSGYAPDKNGRYGNLPYPLINTNEQKLEKFV